MRRVTIEEMEQVLHTVHDTLLALIYGDVNRHSDDQRDFGEVRIEAELKPVSMVRH